MSINYLDKTGLEHIGDIENYKKRNIDYTTYTGTDLEIEDTLENKINFNNLYGQTEQDSYEGKNKIQLSTVSFNNITTTLNSDGSITCNGTTNTTYFNIMSYQKQLENFLPIGTYTFSRIGDATYPVNFILYNSDKTQSKIFTIPSNSTVITGQLEFEAQYCSASYNAPSGTQISFTTKLQFEPGSAATDYEPYVGGTASPNPDYPQEVKTVTGRQVVKITGKNLLDASQGRLGTFNNLTISYSNGNILLNGTSTALVDFYVGTSAYNTDLVNYMNNNLGTYTLSNNLGFENYFRIGGSYLQNQGTITSSNKVDLIFIRIPTGTYDNEILNIQIEKNSTTTEYEEYKEQSYELNLGKNLFDIDGDFTYGGYSDVPIINNDGTLTSNANFSTSRSAGQLISLLKPNTNYILSAKLISTTSTDSNKAVIEILQGVRGNLTTIGRVYFEQTGSKTINFTTSNDVSKIWISISTIGTDSSSTFGNIQLEKGKEATSYSPYFTPIELCKIGDYQDSIKKSTGKNLFDVTEFENNLVTRKIKNDNGEEVSDYNSTYSTYMIPVKANQSYHFYGYFQRIYLYDSNNEWIRRTSAYDGLMDIDFIPTQDGYVQLQIHNNTYNTNKGEEQIELGSKTDYEPYGVGKWYVEKKVGKLIFDGSDDEQWGLASNSRFYCDANLYNGGVLPSTNADDFNAYSNLLKADNYNNSWNNLTNNTISVASNNTSNPRIINANYTDITSFKTWLSNNNVILYYPLSTPTGEEITDEGLIEQLNDLYDAFYMNSKTYINVEGDLPIVLEINHDKPRFLNLIDKGELQKYIIDLEKRVAILESQITE